jgi:cell division initiation protein
VRLTPNDLVNKQFARSRTGYSASEVDDFLREAARDFEQALAESARLQQRLEEMERELERFEAMESTLKEALVLAQMTANETRSLAQREADAILRDAHTRADEVHRDAVWRSESLRQERLRFGWEFRALLQSQLDHLDAELQRSEQSRGVAGASEPAESVELSSGARSRSRRSSSSASEPPEVSEPDSTTSASDDQTPTITHGAD